nr:hypothetical protein [Actinomycetota bacterium]
GLPWRVVAASIPARRSAGLPSREDVARRADELFESIGLQGSVEVVEGPTTMDAVVTPSVRGSRPVGYEQRLSFGAGGEIVGGHGWLGRPIELGNYPVVDGERGLHRLRTGFPLAFGVPSAGDEVQQVVVTGVHDVLQLVDGYLLPAYAVRTPDGPGPTVVAVVDWLLGKPGGKVPRRATTTTEEPAWFEDAESCGASIGGMALDSERGKPVGPEDKPLTVQVCGPTTAEVDEEVVFDVTATDRDADIVESGCGEPVAQYGDEPDSTAVRPGCRPVCSGPPKQGSASTAKQVFRHRYEKKGTYTARFTFQSAFCTTGTSTGTGEHTVVVR